MTVTILNQPSHLCYVKQAWADSWTEASLLEALTISDQAGPGHSSATLRYDFGRGMAPEIGARAADDEPTTIAPADLTGWYVRIDVSGFGSWWGIIVDKSESRDGLFGGTVRSGCENYTAFGLTWLLEQCQPITQSLVKTSGGSALIDRCIPFNGGSDGTRRQNRVSAYNYDEYEKAFTDSDLTTTPKAWKASNGVDYVLENFAPKNAAGSVLIPFALHASALDYLDYELPFIDYDGQKPWEVINRLVDRRRGLGLHATVVSDTVTLVVWSQNASTITLPSGGEIPANANQVTYDFDNASNINGASVATTLLTRYDQIVCVGERAGSVFSVKPGENMEADWPSADETKYNTAASAETGYSTLSNADKQASNQDRRAADDLSRVFSWWRLKKEWDGLCYVEPDFGSPTPALPQIDSDGVVDPDVSSNYLRSGLRFETFLPMRPHVDYTAAITPETADSDDSDSDYIAPFVLYKSQALRYTSTDDDGWMYAERINQANAAGSSKRPYTYSVDVSVREDAPGFVLKTNGVPQHYVAQDLYTENAAFEEIPSGEGFDSEDWLATVYVLHDQYCRAQWPLAAGVPSLDLVNALRLKIPDARLDFILPGTIVGCTAGEIQVTSSGGQLRDDRARLLDIARLAFAWYGQPRRTLNLSFRGIVTGFNVGDLITEIGATGYEETINTCITSVSYDLRAGTTQLHTQFGEMDFAL